MSMHRPGDVLAGRYRLADLLSETGQGRFWLAHDDILGRAVAVHVLDADDERAPALMSAAKSSASIVDARLLRVLDAETREGIAYVVNEWGRGTSLDILLARSGPLPPRQAAWIVAEVAATLARAHELGHAHGRLNPENVLLDEAGAVRVIGFAVEAALYGLPPGTAADDVIDLAGVLEAAVTGTWSGATESSVPRTPQAHGHPLRPRQVRAGVPKALDDLCDHILNPDARGRHQGPTIDARYVRDALLAFVGDPADVAGKRPEEIGGPGETGATGATTAVHAAIPAGGTAPDTPTGNTPTGNTPTGNTPSDTRDTPDTPRDTPIPPAEIPTEAGIPAFEDDDSWHLPRLDPVPPPPPLEPPAPRPLFADEPRVPRADTPGAMPVIDPAEELLPWTEPTSLPPASGTHDTDDTGSSPPTRSRWLPLGVGLLVLVLVVAAVLVVRELVSGGGSSGNAPSTSPSPSTSARTARPITGLIATDFDPLGRPPEENPQDAKYAVDGDPSTSWRTVNYKDQLGPKRPALKSGVGLLIDLRRSYAVSSIDLTLVGSPTAVSIYVTGDKPTGVADLTPAATTEVTGTTATVRISPAAAGRYVVVWLTALPQVKGGFRGMVAEVGVAGSPRG
jgi:serine/threonine protein kinase